MGTDRSQVALLARWALELGSEDRRADGSTEDSWIYTAAGALVWAEDPDVAEQVLGQALDEARRRGSIMAVAKASYRRALSLYRRGRLTDAICDAEEAVGARRHGWELYLPAAHGVLARAWLDRGNLEAAVQALDVGDAEDRWSETNLLALYKEARGRLRLRQGEPGAAFDDFIDAGRILTEVVRAFNPAVSEWRSGAAIAASQLGDEAEARRLAQEELDLARRFAAPAPISAALRASARVEGREAALELLPEALSVLEGSPAELERARTLVELGTALRQTNRRAQAVDLLREGRELAHRCGAASLADRAGKEVLAAGARPRRLAVAGPEALTGSARRVAELAAKGNTNRQIAEHLFVTVKAVEWHLGNVYAKLGISSRRQLPAALAA